MKIYTLLFAAILFTASCKESGKQNNNEPAPVTAKIAQTGFEHTPALRSTDSLQIIFYDNPDGDSLRFNRFFTYTNVGDTAAIHLLMEELDKPASLQTAVKKCRSEGKIYAYAKGEPVKTLYFGTRTADCTYLYYIKDGNFIYLNLSNAFNSYLQQQKRKAIKP
jgi:hypothetical protein